jgi:hypothetical protein
VFRLLFVFISFSTFRTLPKVNLLADMYNVYKHWMNTIIVVLRSQLNLDEFSFVMVDVG